MNMNKRLYKHLHRESGSRSYWFYYHLKHDADFRKEAAELDKKLLITLADGTTYRPTGVEDFDSLQDPDKEKKLALIEKFQIRWEIPSDYYLLYYLIRGNPEYVPPATENKLVALVYKDDRNMFEAQISPSASKEDFDLLRLMLESEKKRLGMDSSEKPRKNFDHRKTAMAYEMWKMRRDKKTWTEVVKAVDSELGHHFEDISTAKKFLKANGYFI